MGHSKPADRKGPEHRSASDAKPRGLRQRDITQVLKILGLVWIAWLVPSRYWHGTIHRIAAFSAKLRPRAFNKRAERIAEILGSRELPLTPLEIEVTRIAGEFEDRLGILRHYRPGAWRPKLKLRGAEHLEAGLAQGSGVILWVFDCFGSRLLTKMAFHQAGFLLWHLSRPGHGFVGTQFGIRYLNDFWTAIEDRYLGERVRLEGGSSRAALDRLKNKLNENGIVSITVAPNARRFIDFPFFAGQLRIPTGPVALAKKTNAVMLPVLTERLDDGSYEISVRAPLSVPYDDDDPAAMAVAPEQLAEILEAFVAEHPGRYRGWHWGYDQYE